MPSRSRQVRRAEARRAQAKQTTRSHQEGRGGGGGEGGGGPDLKDRVPKVSKTTLWLATGALVLVVAAIAVVSLSSSSSSSSESALLTGSGYPNGDTSNTRFTQGSINSSNVSRLQPAWTLPLSAKSQYGSYSASPIISGGAMFSQDLASNVQAINLKTGHVIWTKNFESPDQGPNGLVVAGGRVYGATATAAFALDEKTGQQLWSVTLTRNEHEGIDMAPGYHNGIVYVSTVPGNNEKFYGAGGVGILWALEASTGKKLWHFDTAPESLWGQESVNSGGGLWYTPAFDGEGNMYPRHGGRAGRARTCTPTRSSS
jgi:outer membrane protein assembly factor BamB